jgi:hypothetical protein
MDIVKTAQRTGGGRPSHLAQPRITPGWWEGMDAGMHARLGRTDTRQENGGVKKTVKAEAPSPA